MYNILFWLAIELRNDFVFMSERFPVCNTPYNEAKLSILTVYGTNESSYNCGFGQWKDEGAKNGESEGTSKGHIPTITHFH